MTRKYELTEAEAWQAHILVSDHCATLHNWIALRVESGDFEGAKKLVTELRSHQRLYALLNVDAHRMIDAKAG